MIALIMRMLFQDRGHLFCVQYGTFSRTKSYLENIFISGATVCVVRHISYDSVFFHSYCPHRHYHLLSSQDSRIQDLCVLKRGKSFHITESHIQ